MSVEEEAYKYAPVLERMVALLGAKDSGITFGQAMAQASSELGIQIPEHMVEPLLTAAFKVIAGGRIPGVPDA